MPSSTSAFFKGLAILAALLLTLLAAAGYLLYGEKFRPVGETGLFRSAQLAPESLERHIRESGLRAVLNLRGPNPDQPWYRAETERLDRLGIPRRDIALSARRLPDRDVLRELVQALDTLPRPLLAHCQHGNDRSGLAALLDRLLHGEGIEAAAWEISPLRGVLYPDTVGRQFLAQYQAWLAAQGAEQAPELLRRFIDQAYLDANGNLRFVAEFVNGSRITPDEPPRIGVKKGGMIVIEGWGFEPSAPAPASPLRSIGFRLGDQPLGEARLGLPRPDVNRVYGLPDPIQAGWRLETPPPPALSGCEPLRMEMETATGRRWQSPPLATLCLGE